MTSASQESRSTHNRPIPGRPTLAAVAARAGVSASTASLAFSGSGPVAAATRERVLDAARELEYGGPDPRARSLRRGRSGIVGVVIEERVRDAFRDPITIAMLDGLSEAIGAIDAGLLLLTDTADAAASVAAAPADAMVLIACSPRHTESVAVLRRRGIPLVSIEGHAEPGVVSISLDNRVATRTVARHLYDLGHRKVALVTLPVNAARSRARLTPARQTGAQAPTTLDRIEGARDVFPGAGGVASAASLIEEGLIAGSSILASAGARPTAIIAQSDLLAAGVIRAAAELGISVPEELSVVGFDGVRVDGLAPYDLTTMVQPAVAKGRAAGAAVLAMLAGEPAEPMIFTSTFHLGNTTAPPSDH